MYYSHFSPCSHALICEHKVQFSFGHFQSCSWLSVYWWTCEHHNFCWGQRSYKWNYRELAEYTFQLLQCQTSFTSASSLDLQLPIHLAVLFKLFPSSWSAATRQKGLCSNEAQLFLLLFHGSICSVGAPTNTETSPPREAWPGLITCHYCPIKFSDADEQTTTHRENVKNPVRIRVNGHFTALIHSLKDSTEEVLKLLKRCFQPQQKIQLL